MVPRLVLFYLEAKKTVVAGAGLLASLLAFGLIPAPYDGIVSGVLAALTAAGVYRASNLPKRDVTPDPRPDLPGDATFTS